MLTFGQSGVAHTAWLVLLYMNSEEYGDKVNFVKVNVDENNELAQKFNVFSIPTLAIFKDGQVISQKVGAATKESFKTMIDSSLS